MYRHLIPSKSALNAVQTKGCNWIAFPSINFGWNACIPNLCKVGARFSKIGCPLITFSRYPKLQALLSIIFFLILLFYNSSFYQFTDNERFV
jgi:hypothetical protein